MSPTRTDPLIRNFSASQINAFNSCQRLWFLQSILRIRFPSTQAQKRGKEIHAILEHWLKTGELLTDHPLEFWRYIEWLIPFMPDWREPDLAIEQEIWMDTPAGTPLNFFDVPAGTPLLGYIDLGRWSLEIPIIGDLKTTTNMRYAKTPAELNQDTQLNTYARWVFGMEPSLDTVKVGHWYLKVEGPGKKPPKNIRSKKVLPVFTEITREGNEKVWQRDCATMEQMHEVSLTARWEDVEPNLNHCSAYGGCDFREKCGISAMDTLFQKPTKGQDMSFLDRIKSTEKNNTPKVIDMESKEAPKKVAKAKAAPKAKAKAAPKAKAKAAPKAKATATKGSFLANLGKKPIKLATKKPVANTPEEDQAGADEKAAQAVEAAEEAAQATMFDESAAVRPPDAASPTPSAEESEGIRNEAQAKLEAKEAKKAAAAEKKDAAKGAKPRKGKHKREMTLYIGCTPNKGEDLAFTLVEDWIAPVLAELNATVLESTKKQDYRLLGYAEEKVALTEAVSSKVREGDLPRAMVCMNSGIGREVATILIPLATDVVSASK